MPPAARLTDMHTCPLATPTPHVGGPVSAPGCPTVLVAGPPDARIMDVCVCAGPPDPISMGSSSVLIGGMPASRMGDATSHGGAIIVGAPNVLIGDPAVTMAVASGQTPEFIAALQQALSLILPTPSGIEWLRQMGLNGRTVIFQETAAQNGGCTAANGADASNGTGSDSTIDWNPNFHVLDPGLPGTQGSPGAPVILAHEMVHALHSANGDDRDGPDDSFAGQSRPSARNEERSTVGTGGSPIQTPTGADPHPPDYSNDVPTENSFRRDLGIPERPGYYPSNWPGGAPW